jgi:molybdopterin synthase catalytic subunit
MNLEKLIQAVKHHPDFTRVGMMLCHVGVVRSSSRDGRPVTGLRVAVDPERLAAVLETHRRRPGIVDIQVEIAADRDLALGETVMHLVVAGDVREHVIETLADTLDAVKRTVTRKTEYFAD